MTLTPLKIGTALVGALAVAEQVAPMLPPQYAGAVHALLPFVALIAGLLAPQVKPRRGAKAGAQLARPSGESGIDFNAIDGDQ
jgi:hypothetical protein